MTASSTRSVARLACSLILGSSLACASAPPSTGTPATPVPQPDTTVSLPQQPGTPVATVVPLGYTPGTYAFDLEQTTVIAVGADSVGTVQDTLLTTAVLRYSIERPGDTLRVTGTIDSLSISSARDSAGPRVLMAPVAVTLEPRVDTVPLTPIDSGLTPASCDSMDEAARALARDVHLRLPGTVLPRQQWTDSTTTMVCRGGIPMTATTTSSFEVRDALARGDSLVVQILRRSRLTLAGTGLQGTRRISVTGSGISETLFTYDLRSGSFVESQGQSALQLRFETIQQTEQVSQRSMSRVRRRAGGS